MSKLAKQAQKQGIGLLEFFTLKKLTLYTTMFFVDKKLFNERKGRNTDPQYKGVCFSFLHDLSDKKLDMGRRGRDKELKQLEAQ